MAVTETWYCETCKVDLSNRKAVLAHLREAHGETSDNPSGSKHMVSHMDGRDWYGGTDRWLFENGAVLLSTYRATRRKNDMMRFED